MACWSEYENYKEWYIFADNDVVRLAFISTDHRAQGLGRGVVQLQNNNVLIVRHRI